MLYTTLPLSCYLVVDLNNNDDDTNNNNNNYNNLGKQQQQLDVPV